MAKGKGVKLNNCTPNNVLALFDRLGGFVIKEGAKHTKITHLESGKATTIPRKKRIDRYLLKQNIIKQFLVKSLGFSLEDIYNNLDC